MYLFLGSLIPGNSFFELSEIPFLIKHYQYHRTNDNPGIDVYEFLAMHYNNPNHENSDPAHHQKLPMHHRGILIPMDEIVFSGVSIKNSVCSYKPATISTDGLDLCVTQPKIRGVFHPPDIQSFS